MIRSSDSTSPRCAPQHWRRGAACVLLALGSCSCARAAEGDANTRPDASRPSSGAGGVEGDAPAEIPRPVPPALSEGGKAGAGGTGPGDAVAGSGPEGAAGGSLPVDSDAGAGGAATVDAGTMPSGSDACDELRAFAIQDIAVEHLAGEDDLGLATATSRSAILRLSSSDFAPETLVASFFSAFQPDDTADPPQCLKNSLLIFAQRERPELGMEMEYSLSEVPTEWRSTDGHTPIFFVDVRRDEDPSTFWIAGTTIDYVGTSGTYEFIELDEPGEYCQEFLGCSPVFYHSMRFDVVFNAVSAGQVDESVATRLSGELRFFSSDPW